MLKRLPVLFQAQEDEKQQASRREFSVLMDRKTTITTEDHPRHHQSNTARQLSMHRGPSSTRTTPRPWRSFKVIERHHVSFATMTTRQSREIRVPRESFYDFVDKTIDRFAETSEAPFQTWHSEFSARRARYRVTITTFILQPKRKFST